VLAARPKRTRHDPLRCVSPLTSSSRPAQTQNQADVMNVIQPP
jgi:hypothetical protein